MIRKISSGASPLSAQFTPIGKPMLVGSREYVEAHLKVYSGRPEDYDIVIVEPKDLKKKTG